MKWGHATVKSTKNCSFPLFSRIPAGGGCGFLQSLGEFPFGPSTCGRVGTSKGLSPGRTLANPSKANVWLPAVTLESLRAQLEKKIA